MLWLHAKTLNEAQVRVSQLTEVETRSDVMGSVASRVVGEDIG